MTPQQILPAIPRQKVMKKNGLICDVLGYSKYQEELVIFDGEDIDVISPEDCEPVPEEPRVFKVGDALYNDYCGFFRAVSVKDETEVLLPNGNWAHSAFIRFATPEEEARYFN